MNRNQNSHFAMNPTNIDISRSRFDRSHSVKTTMNVGDIIPFYCDEVLPGDTFDIKTSKVVRLQTMLTPMMDNLYLDTYYFFVPNRLVWQHWKEFMGENTASAWLPTTTYQVPQLTAPSGGWNVGTIADYFGVPTGVDNLSVNALPFRAYALICNEWFRSENLSDPLNIPVTDATVAGVNTGTFVSDVAKGGLPYTAAKYFDYFTGALPYPQKHADVAIPGASAGLIPVITGSDDIALGSYKAPFKFYQAAAGSSTLPTSSNTESLQVNTQFPIGGGNDTSTRFYGTSSSYYNVFPANLYADMSAGGSNSTINQLRLAFQIQKLYEKDARGGTRYIEILKSHFGVTSPDARLQRPEYLGGNRIGINVNQIVQQSGTVSGGLTPQGTPVGLSMTTDHNNDFTRSFVEHGYVIGLCVARYDHTYQQGLERFWSRKDRTDFYFPVLANIGEQAIKNKEIYAQGSAVVDSDGNVIDDQVFGYQEAWADYRYKPNRCTGEMRSTYTLPLDSWHLGDKYTSLPTLSDSWIREDKSNVDRVLAIKSSVSDQLFMDIYIKNLCTRAMPMYSIPGLIDHH